MVVARILATPVAADAITAQKNGNFGVLLHGQGTPGLSGLGANLARTIVRDLPGSPSPLAWDFLAIAMAVFAADRFVLRHQAEDGWTRVMSLEIALANPVPWIAELFRLQAALRFLTGDIWQISLRDGGEPPPTIKRRQSDRNVITLFSGGLDSLLGAIRLQEEGKRPYLVSQGSPKEVGPQMALAETLGLLGNRFDGRIHERWRAPYEASTRGRSLVFFAYGILAATAHDLHEIIIPENGFIAINPPLTPRRLGSLSTRTTHPYFLGELQNILRSAGLDILLTNIFEGATKGEMLASCKHPDLQELAARSYSCGKGKRLNAQCGRCVPCLIRRASFEAAKLPDNSHYYVEDLSLSGKNDDVLAARLAVARMNVSSNQELARWATLSGPLPHAPDRREKIVGAVTRGLAELAQFLDKVEWPL